MNNRIKVTIIVPVYNTENYLSQCLDSLLNQTYKNIEVVLVDDGSSDNSPQLCDKYGQLDCRIKVIHKENEGVSSARNTALDHASGDYIVFVDSDDWIDLNTIEAVVNEIKLTSPDLILWSYYREYPSGPKRTLLFGDKRNTWDKSNIEELYLQMIGLTGKQLEKPYMVDTLVAAGFRAYSRSLIGNMRFIDTSIIGTEDPLFNIQVCSALSSAVYLPKAYYHYRKDNTQSLTTAYNDKLADRWQNFYEYIYKHLNSNKYSSVYYLALDNRIALGLIGLTLNLERDKRYSFKDKNKELKTILNMEHYIGPLQRFQKEYLPFVWKLFYKFICRKNTFMTLLMCKAINLLRK